MSLVSLSTYDLIHCEHGYYNYTERKVRPSKYRIKKDVKLNKDDTYMVVFNKQAQEKAEELFNTIKEFNILYKSPTAVNRNHGDDANRNTLYIFEVK